MYVCNHEVSICPSLVNFISAQRHCLYAPYRSRSVFTTAGEAVVEAKPISTPTIKYDLLKDLETLRSSSCGICV